MDRWGALIGDGLLRWMDTVFQLFERAEQEETVRYVRLPTSEEACGRLMDRWPPPYRHDTDYCHVRIIIQIAFDEEASYHKAKQAARFECGFGIESFTVTLFLDVLISSHSYLNALLSPRGAVWIALLEC
ncbi:unnamed protein product [Prorocentrum cordatum]|uniref:Uncharacterized protein n=1 Tax=Prorocentrum cordatum TaxID=2364126 RepID=A0ABN9TAF2_9DINO|nr:unnamed protein product [Polarella glacialis]